jgi:glycosyltransferase involved in cell wall biosynthesis
LSPTVVEQLSALVVLAVRALRNGIHGHAVDLSVVIATYNGARTLGDQLRSLSRQEFGDDWELVIADNGSTDRTRDVIREWEGHFSHVVVVDASAKKGQSYALNRAVGAAEGEAIVILDDDDETAPGYLAAMAHALQTHEFVAARLDCETLNDPWTLGARPPVQTTGLGVYASFLPAAGGASIGLRRATFDSIGAFDEELDAGLDLDFCWRHLLNGGDIAFVDDAVLRYRYRSDLRGIYRQARGYGFSAPSLYRRYRAHGMPRRSALAALRFWLGPLRRLVRARHRSDLAALAFMAGYRVGLLAGSGHARLMFL